MQGKVEGKRRRGATEDEMVGGRHRLDGQEFEQTPGDGDGRGSLVCCNPWGCKELDMTQQLKKNNKSNTTCWGKIGGKTQALFSLGIIAWHIF